MNTSYMDSPKRENILFSNKSKDAYISLNSIEDNYEVSGWRYYILILYMLMIYWTAMLRTSDSNINLILDELYGMSPTSHTVLNKLPEILFLPGAILSTYLFNKFSLKTGLGIGMMILSLGAWMNILATMHYSCLFLGQSLCALANPTIILSWSLVAVKWFEDSKRVLATSIAVSITYSWFIKGFGIPNFVVNIEEDEQSLQGQLALIFGVEASVTVFITILTFVSFKSEPLLPPSAAAEVNRDDDILGTYRALIWNREFMLLTWSQVWYYAMIIGIDDNFVTIAKLYKYSDSQILNCELINVNFGVLGSIILGIFLHFTKLYKTANAGIGLASLIWVIWLIFTFDRGYTSLSILYGFLGFMQYPLITICYIYSSEVAYPLKETTVLGFIRCLSVVIGYLVCLVSWIMLRYLNSKHTADIFIIVMCVLTFFGIIFALLMKPIKSSAIKHDQLGKFYRKW